MKLLILGYGPTDHPLLERAAQRDEGDFWLYLGPVFGELVVDKLYQTDASWCLLLEVDGPRAADGVPDLLQAPGVLGVASSEILADHLSVLFGEANRWRQHARDWQAGAAIVAWFEREEATLGGYIARTSQRVDAPIRVVALRGGPAPAGRTRGRPPRAARPPRRAEGARESVTPRPSRFGEHGKAPRFAPSQRGRRHTSLYIPRAMLAELEAEAVRLDRSVSWLLRQAYRRARAAILALPRDPPEA